MKIKIIYDCDDSNTQLVSIREFVEMFNNMQVNSFTDKIIIIYNKQEGSND